MQVYPYKDFVRHQPSVREHVHCEEDLIRTRLVRHSRRRLSSDPVHSGGDNGENTVLGSTWETYRRQIVLDYGLNANYMLDQNMPGAINTNTGTASQGSDNSDFVNTGATVYKFYPPTLATTGTTGYNYVAECSNRGICDSETGLCNCFPGYSGDDCGMVSSLVQ